MFISKQHLHYNLGVDLGIATFFVDRKVPVDNSYWKGKLLYISSGTGYSFIPLFLDLQYKCGVSREEILKEEYVQVMESILHSAALHEAEIITFSKHISNCKHILSGKVKNEELYNDLLEYFKNGDLAPYKNLGTKSKALNRGDTFLFSLCYAGFSNELTNKIIQQWYALVSSFLLMDDLIDLKQDLQNNHENSVADFGKGNSGLQQAIEFLRTNFNELNKTNDKLGVYFERLLDRQLETPYLQSILKVTGHYGT